MHLLYRCCSQVCSRVVCTQESGRPALLHTPHADTSLPLFCQLMHCWLQGRTVRDFIRALKSAYAVGAEALADDEPLAADAFDWSALARASAPRFRMAPGVSCMLGPMDAAPKAR